LITLLLQQGEEVCQSVIGKRYLQSLEDKNYGVFAASKLFGYVTRSHPPSLCAFALTQERITPGGIRYVYLDVLCARKNLKLGTMLFHEVLNHYRKYNEGFDKRSSARFQFLELRALPSVVGYYLKQGFRWGSPRFDRLYVLLQGENAEDGLYMHLFF
jgi:hypothetical protein